VLYLLAHPSGNCINGVVYHGRDVNVPTSNAPLDAIELRDCACAVLPFLQVTAELESPPPSDNQALIQSDRACDGLSVSERVSRQNQLYHAKCRSAPGSVTCDYSDSDGIRTA
jgi:hypothetical protein